MAANRMGILAVFGCYRIGQFLEILKIFLKKFP